MSRVSSNQSGTMVPLTPYQAHCQRWDNGCGSNHCAKATKCFARGKICCGIYFVGEAPGESEDSLGIPFCGPAGDLQDRLIAGANTYTNGKIEQVGVGFTNLVCCIPRDESNSKASEPDDDQIDKCRPRLEELLEIAQPKLIFAVGRHAQDYLEAGHKWSVKLPASVAEVVHLKHPSAILQATEAQQGLDKRRFVVTVANAVERVFGK